VLRPRDERLGQLEQRVAPLGSLRTVHARFGSLLTNTAAPKIVGMSDTRAENPCGQLLHKKHAQSPMMRRQLANCGKRQTPMTFYGHAVEFPPLAGARRVRCRHGVLVRVPA
jgi:hypothetical protein